MTDRELLQRYKDGDGNAFTDFFNRHAKSVTRWVAYRWRLPLSDIDNAVQMAFIGISRREEIPEEPLAYLQQAALQNAKMIKARKNLATQSGDVTTTSIHDLETDGVITTCDREGSTHFVAPEETDWVNLRQLGESLDKAIKSLPPKQAEVIYELRKDANMTNVAKKLGVNWLTAKRRHAKAVGNLRELMA
jgi:DNA-directed RNA polymerase specialized sigma24 family protein